MIWQVVSTSHGAGYRVSQKFAFFAQPISHLFFFHLFSALSRQNPHSVIKTTQIIILIYLQEIHGTSTNAEVGSRTYQSASGRVFRVISMVKLMDFRFPLLDFHYLSYRTWTECESIYPRVGGHIY